MVYTGVITLMLKQYLPENNMTILFILISELEQPISFLFRCIHEITP